MSTSGKLRRASVLGWMVALVLARHASAACVPTMQWRWEGTVRDPSHPAPLSLPVVARLTDHDGNGVIDQRDRPDVAFISCSSSLVDGLVHVLDSIDGSDIRTFTTREVSLTALAAGDLDGDGVVELVTFGDEGQTLVAFHADGSILFDVPIGVQIVNCWSLGLADIDQDGSPEIYFGGRVHRADGAFWWAGTGGRGVPQGDVESNVAVDLLPNAGLELVAGNTCYAADGTILWQRGDIFDGLSSVGDLDGDGTPEVVLVSSGGATQVHVLSSTGASLAPPVGVGFGSTAPAGLLDLDGDGDLEVVVAWGERVEAYDWTGSSLASLWQAAATDGSCCGGLSGFDLDGDGELEVLYRGDQGVYVIDGSDGSLAWSAPDPSYTGLELPVVADIDLDGIPEIVSTGATSDGVVAAYECGVPLPARCIWNELSYHVTNVEDDGTIPAVEVAPWTVSAGYLQQEASSCCDAGEIVPMPGTTICEGSSAILSAPALVPPGCTSGDWIWRDALGGVIATVPSVGVSPGTTTTYDVSFTCTSPPDCGHRARVTVQVDLPPLLDPASLKARDPDPCNLGIEVSWLPAIFRDPTGTGVYDVRRSETSCLDAITSPPLATGVLLPLWIDTTTEAGHSYWYVVQAEDARTLTACVPGPDHGGATNVVLACVGPVLESPEAYTPDLLGWALRARHVGHVVTMSWPGGRALLPEEHYHVLKGYEDAAFPRVNGEGSLSTTFVETDVSRPLQFFDVRIANACEIQSLDDEPRGWDHPH